ncbi:hypothetical protein [Phaeacidiphilus oryzae]|uniref:hypothetical protein n=1 Tax=Phaeacidiphilus oryzae TaxID=348818 RepID=UPI0005692834|nr:hypothetical protein [Phaeacidiphilus oryzae]
MSLLNWRDHSHWNEREADCVLCANPTHLRSDRGRPVHKVCAEQWNDAHTPSDEKKGERR